MSQSTYTRFRKAMAKQISPQKLVCVCCSKPRSSRNEKRHPLYCSRPACIKVQQAINGSTSDACRIEVHHYYYYVPEAVQPPADLSSVQSSDTVKSDIPELDSYSYPKPKLSPILENQEIDTLIEEKRPIVVYKTKPYLYTR
jgi:hypothetical protein